MLNCRMVRFTRHVISKVLGSPRFVPLGPKFCFAEQARPDLENHILVPLAPTNYSLLTTNE